jgi:TP901 family phage tail tape measure protein
MPLQIPVTQTGLEASIEAAAKKAGRNLSINLGTNTRSISALSQPLGRITGQADEFTKSMEAANARVFAFGASVGIINGVTQAFGTLVRNTIEVEKSLVEINTVLNASSDSLQEFGNKLFDVAKTTGQTFDTVAKGALELARQGLGTEETLKRINDALILSRLSGLDAQQSVEGLTAAFNSFQETGITTSQILNKLVVVSQKYSVSERDLIEGLKRSASVADQAGVSFDELVGIITTVQERTARGGAVIGNAFKTIFARIQDRGALEDLAGFGIKIQDLQGKILPATQILQNLAGEFNNLTQVEQADLAKKLGGVYQLSNLLAAVKDLSSEQSKYVDIVKLSAGATNEAYKKNAALNETLATLINKVTLSAQQLGATLGEIGIADGLKKVLDFVNYIFEGFQKILGEESALGTLFKGIAQGIGNVLAGPGLAIFAAIIGKLSIQLAGFGIEALKSFFKINSTSKELQNIQGAITSTLLNNKQIQQQILSLEGNRVAQAQFISTALNEQLKTMQRMQSIAASITPDVYAATSGARKSGSKNVAGAAGGYMPAVAGEASDIRRGVGGAKAGDKPVVIPNFAFGGGKKGTMVAHTGEYIIPNFAGGGSAIFNRDMVRSMGLPAGAKKIGAAGGFIPNFAEWYNRDTTKVKTSTSMPTTAGDWIKVRSSSESIRKYSENVDQYKVRDTDFYLFPDGTGSRGNTVRDTLGRNKSRAVEKAEEEQEKVNKAGSFTLNADQLGGIGLISPRFGKSGVGSVDTKMTAGEVAFFNQNETSFPIDKNKYIKLLGIKTANTPSGRSFQQLQGDVSQLFAGGVVDLAYRLYGGTFDPASGGEFTQKLRALSPDKKQQLIPAAAQGDLFEAAGKVALGSIQNLESLFNQSDQNRPFDFNNRAAMQKMFGFSVGKGEAKRGGEGDSLAAFLGTKQVKGIITKVFNDPEYSPKALDALKAQGAFSPEMQKKKKEEEISNAIGGFIPNFADEMLGKEISKKSGSDLHLKDGILKVGFLRSREGNPLFEIARLINENKIKAIDAGGIIGPKIPDLIIGLKKMIERKRVKDPSFPRIKIKGFFRPGHLAEKISEQSEYKYKYKHGDLLKYYTKGYDYYGRKDQRNFVSAMDQMKLNRKDNSFIELEKLYPEGFAKGYIPNFADPLKEAIDREMSAGVPASQIYVDQNSSLKNSMNPMGLMVANRRDEPSSGMQGINRARKEGANPMLYGAARGFVPNYANLTEGTMYDRKISQILKIPKESINELQNDLLKVKQGIMGFSEALDKYEPKVAKAKGSTTVLAQLIENAVNPKAASIYRAQEKKNEASKSIEQAVEEPGSTQKVQKDMLGTIFAVQTGLSFLVGVLDDAESVFGAVAGAMANVASSATSVYFLFEGLKGVGGKFGDIAGKLGLWGAAAAGLYEGFNLIAKNLDSTNASINNASHAMESFAKVAAGATVNFGTLSESQKKRIQTSREGLIEGGRRFLGYQGTVGFAGRTKATNVATFEGYSGELEKQFEGAIDQALAVGVSYDVMFNRIRKAAESGNKITAEEVENMINEFKTLAEEIAKVKPTDFLKNSGLFEGGENEKYFKKLEKLSSKELDAQLDLFKEKGTRGKQGVPFLQELIEKYTPINNLTATKEFAKLSLKTSKETKETQKEAVGAAIETANLSLLKQQLENRMAYKKALFEASSAEEYSLELQKEMLSVSEKDRTLADYKLQSLQAAKKLTSDQADATINALKESELIQKKLEGMSPGGKIDPKEFEKLTSAAEKVSDIIREQGGYTEDAKNKTQELLAKTGLLPDQYGIILDIIKETNDQLSRQAALQNKMYALSNLQKATIEAANFATEKRSAAITNQYDKELKLNELQKRRIDLEKEAGVLQLERRKIGGGAGSNLGIDREIAQLEKNAIKLKFDIDQKNLISQVKKALAEAALSAGLTPNEVGNLNLQNVTTKEQAVAKAKEIEEIEKKIKIDKLEAAQKEFEKQVTASVFHYDQVVNAAKEFARIIGELGYGPSVNSGTDYGALFRPPNTSPVMLPETVVTADEEGRVDKQMLEQSRLDAAEAIKKIKESSGSVSVLGDQIGATFDEASLNTLELNNAFTQLDNSLLSAGGSLTTFNNLVRDVFKNLPENISQNKFAMLTATDTQSIIGNAVEARRNDILSQGPASAGTIAQAADATAIYEKELEIKRAITAEDKINGEFELQKLKEILPLRMQLLEAETNSEREAIIDRIIAKEKQRLPVLQRIKAEFSSTTEQRTAELEDSLVNASVQFRDNLIDGISQAIEGGGSLKDILLSAALDFAREMTKASIKNAVSSIGSLFNFGGGGGVTTAASGGMINGGSGTKDDVPAMLMGGEYVVKKKAVQKYGPDFLNAINNGTLGGYAKGGSVKKPTQTGEGGYFLPGLYGNESISGTDALMSFATQNYTSGARDVISSGSNFASIDLEQESVRLTQRGRENSPLFAATQSAKEQALGMVFEQVRREEEYRKAIEEAKKQEKARQKAIRKQLLISSAMAIGSAVAGPLLGAAGAGAKAAFGASKAAGGTLFTNIGAAAKGVFTGGQVGGQMVGGLGNLFTGVGKTLTGNFAEAGNFFKLSQIGDAQGLAKAYNAGLGLDGKTSNFTKFLDKSGYVPRAIVDEVGTNGVGGNWFSRLIGGFRNPFGTGSNKDSQGFESTAQDIQPSLWERITGKRNTIDPYSLMSEDEMAELRKDPVLGYMDNGAQDPRSWKRRATGGTIPETSGIDTVPTMLSGGEFIMNRAAAQNIGAGNLQALNAGASALPTEEKTEELNDKLISKLDELIQANSSKSSVGAININVDGSGKSNESSSAGQSGTANQQLARNIRDMVVKVIQDEQRLGGLLR